jgi:hypothetical protein
MIPWKQRDKENFSMFLVPKGMMGFTLFNYVD